MFTRVRLCVTSAADILVYINNSCVLGRSHKEVVEMLKSVPMGQSVDVVLRRGYPMLYNPDGCPKQSLEPPAPREPPKLHQHLTYSQPTEANGGSAGRPPFRLWTRTPVCSNVPLAVSLCLSGPGQNPSPGAAQPMTNGTPGPSTPTSSASLPPSDRTTANHSDSDGGQSGSESRRLVLA